MLETGGQRVGVITLIKDISEVASLESELRTAEKLTSLGTLSAGIAHEIKNPLSAIDLNLRLLEMELPREENQGSETDDYFRILREEIGRLNAIVDNVLRFSRPSQTPSGPVDIVDVVQRTLELLGSTCRERGISIDLALNGSSFAVLGDTSSLQQAFLNILLNAIQSMNQPGRIQIFLSVRGEGPGSWCEMAFQDSGCGINSKDIERIFDPFFTNKPGGTGLGLSIVHRIIVDHKGTIHIASTPGKGTRVVLRLADGETGSVVMTNRVPRILIVDDEKNIRTALASLLRKEGFDAQAEGNPEAVADLAAAGHFNIVITDLRMEPKSGIEVMEDIRRKSPESEVVIMTAYASVETAVEAIKKGAYDYVTKPVDPERLKRVIEQILERQSLKEENVALRRRLSLKDQYGRLIGASVQMRQIFRTIDGIAPTPATVLIAGESGTGKELVAKAIHERSPRAGGPFISINCGAIPESLLESELFGSDKGAFTGADRDRPGRIEMASGGPYFWMRLERCPPGLRSNF